MMKAQFILTVLLLNLYAKTSGAQSLDTIDFRMVQQLAKKIGEELWSVSDAITKRVEIQESFSQARVVNKSGTRLVDEIARDLKVMLDVRINSVKRIVKVAENLTNVQENSTFYDDYSFVNTRERDLFRKEILRLKKIEDERLEKLSSDANYTKKRKPNYDAIICYKSDNPPVEDEDEDDDEDQEGMKAKYGCYAKFNETVNVKSREASVFLPVDVFDKDGNLTRIIHRTKGLDRAFLANYRHDPTIGWQYFCNSTGLFRHFPATEWNFHPINTYDCRMRHWFTGAASSSKDVMILVERAGSMLGKRINIAKDVIRQILDTLTPNDYVNILQFNDTAEYILECASKSLIQATATNIFDLKQALNDIEPSGQTDLAESLKEAFEILANHTMTSSNCNQVIMLITDGMEYNETIQGIFRDYNWKNGNNVRVFSFLIGEQIPEGDFEQVKLMACENRGYYAQIDTLSETRENALKYIPVISRPLVLSTQNPIVWSNLYADVIDSIRTTNYDWNCKQREMQRERMTGYLSEYDWYPCLELKDPEEVDPEYRKYLFMTTVSMPAFDRAVNESHLMGVAAIDVPLFEFERLFQRHRLGVFGYMFVIDQNGNILSHPDFRPFFQGKILKPSYNSVDMAEVELMNDGYDARDFSSFLLEFRKAIIEKPMGSKFMLALQPYDDMRRALQLRRNYYWRKISDTPFTVVASFPEHLVGRVQVPESEIDSMMTKGSNLLKYFQDDFRLHPDWIYCRGIRKGFEDMKLGLIDPDNCEMTPEEELMFYLEKLEISGWKWKQDKLDSNETRCDRRLMQLLLFDAKATNGFPAEFPKRSKEMGFIDRFKIKTSFISTHSGLFRFKIFDKKVRPEKFASKMKNGIDEDWYKHAVDYNKENPDSYVYSVHFGAYEQTDPRITVTHAVFIRDGSDKAPLAVIGYQFAHAKLEEIMEKSCIRNKDKLCYIIDDNAYILSDPEANYTGMFFGSVENRLMRILVEDGVYEPIKVYDYQAVCYEDKMTEYGAIMKRLHNSALKAMLWNPFEYLIATFFTLLSTAYALPAYISNLMYPDREHYYNADDYLNFSCPNIHEKEFMTCLKENEVTSNDTLNKKYYDCLEKKKLRYKNCFGESGAEFILKRHLNRSRPYKCDKFNVVYTLTRDESNFLKPYDECSRPFVVHKIAHSNLILLITNLNCARTSGTYKEFNNVPKTIEYENSTFCHKMRMPPLFRSRPKSCLTHHFKEPIFDVANKDRSQCGRGSRIAFSSSLAIFVVLTLLKVLVPN